MDLGLIQEKEERGRNLDRWTCRFKTCSVTWGLT